MSLRETVRYNHYKYVASSVNLRIVEILSLVNQFHVLKP